MLGLTFLASPDRIHAQSSASVLKRQIDASASRWLKENDVPSVAIAYIEHGQVAWTGVYGEQSPSVPATPKTLYNIASLTKPITAQVVLRLASKGKVSLDESISPYWIDPDLKGNPWADLLTPRLCLSHQTGFANWRRMTDGVLKFKFKPGTATGYSGEGYAYVARYTEKKTGRSFEALAQQYVFDPLRMHDTSYTPKPWFTGRRALPHGPDGPAADLDDWSFKAADLVRTTVGDYAKFVVAVMHNDGLSPSFATQRAIITRNQATPEQVAKICASAGEAAPCTIEVGMGLGWQVDHFNGETLLEHGGSDAGVHTFAVFSPKNDTGVVIFTNGENGTKVIAEALRVLYPNRILLQTIH